MSEEPDEGLERSRREVLKNSIYKLQNPKEPAIQGLIVAIPVVATLAVMEWLFDRVNEIPGNSFFDLTQNFYVNQTLKLSMLLAAAGIVVTGIGRLVRTEPGYRAEKLLDEFMDRVPFLGSVYNITKVTAETVLAGPEGLKKPAKINFGKYRVTAFKTGNRAADGREVVFVPTSPNITTGFVLEVEDEQIEETDETAEEALTRVLSAGFGDSNQNRKDG